MTFPHVDSPAAWRVSEIEQDKGWIFRLDDAARAQLATAVKAAFDADRPLFDYRGQDIDLGPALDTIRDAAKEAQGLLEAKISKLKNTLANARLVDDSKIDNTKVYILSTVKIRNTKNNAEVTYTLVAENEANLAEKKISIDSPIGKGLLGKSVGDIAEVQVPAGIIPFEVLEISRG